MNLRRDHRSSRTALFDTIEEGRLPVSSLYSSNEIDEHTNEIALDVLHDRVNILKRLTGEIHEEVDNQDRVLNRVGHNMDASRGVLYRTLNGFKTVFAVKSVQRISTLALFFVVSFLIVYYLAK